MEEFRISIGIEEWVKLECLSTDCKYNLSRYGFAACNRKVLEIAENGICGSYEPNESLPLCQEQAVTGINYTSHILT